MRKLFFVMLITLIPLVSPPSINAQSKPIDTSFFKGEIVAIDKQENHGSGDLTTTTQFLKVRLLESPKKGNIVPIQYENVPTSPFQQKLSVGDAIVVNMFPNKAGQTTYAVFDKYRIDKLAIIAILFLIVVIIAAGKRGVGSVAGLVISLLVISLFIVPQIIAGNDPLIISILGSIIIMIVTIYMAHGFSQQTSVAIGGTFVSLVIAGLLGFAFVKYLPLTGLGSEDAYSLQMGLRNVNFQGVLLGGIIIGTLGVLAEITTTQSATIFELARTNTKLTFTQLFQKGFSIGKEHVLSLVNTLILAYAGASIAIFIYIYVSVVNNTQPLWVMLNSELIAEEIVRTLAGSIGLILAVPLTTLLATFICKYNIKIS